MSIRNFSNSLYIVELEHDENILAGSFSTANSLELKYIRVMFLMRGAYSPTEKIRINVCSDLNGEDVLFSSSWVFLSEITGYSTNWLGWIGFTFGNENINKSATYHFKVEVSGYTKTASRSISCVFDYPIPIYDNLEEDFNAHPVSFLIYGVKN